MTGKRAVSERPKLAGAYAEMRTYGTPLNKLLDSTSKCGPRSTDEASRALVNTGAHHIATFLARCRTL